MPPWARALVAQMAHLRIALEAAQLHMIDIHFAVLALEGERASRAPDG